MRYYRRKVKKPYRPRKLYKSRRKINLTLNRFSLALIMILVALLSSFYLFSFYSFFQIKIVEISGNEKTATQDILNLVEINIPRKVLLFNSESIFLIDLEKTGKEILDGFPQIGRVTFEKKLPNKLKISVEERKPVALFGTEELFFVDEEGIAFEKVEEKDSWLVIDNPDLVNNLKLGESVIDEERLSRVIEIKSRLEESGIEIGSVEIVNHQRVNARTREGWTIYFNLDNDISQQVLNLTLVLEEKISSEERGNLEYIDLRFGNQVFYK